MYAYRIAEVRRKNQADFLRNALKLRKLRILKSYIKTVFENNLEEKYFLTKYYYENNFNSAVRYSC